MYYTIVIPEESDEILYAEDLDPLLALAEAAADTAVIELLSLLRPGNSITCVLFERKFEVSCVEGDVDDVDKRSTAQILGGAAAGLEKEIARRTNGS